MFVTPNFRIEPDANSHLLTPKLEDGIINEYLYVEKLGTATPKTYSEKINRDRVLLSPLDDLKSMWLYPNGKIKIER